MYVNWKNYVSRKTRLKFRKLKGKKAKGRYLKCEIYLWDVLLTIYKILKKSLLEVSKEYSPLKIETLFLVWSSKWAVNK